MSNTPGDKAKLQIVGEFFGHLLAGAAMFIGVAAVGGLLSLIVQWLPGVVHDTEFVDLMKRTERFILYMDVGFLCWWACYSVYRASKELMK